MIGRLRGILAEKIPPRLLVDVNGVYYELDAPMNTFYRLPEVGAEVTLFTHLVVREDAQLLYAFSQEQERALFRSLIKVSNVGPKLAVAILSGIEPDAFVHCIMKNDITTLTRIPGVGKKTAERLIIEMRDRLTDWEAHSLPQQTADMVVFSDKLATQEAISALIALGYKPQEASRAISKVQQENMSSADLIRQALRSLVQ